MIEAPKLTDLAERIEASTEEMNDLVERMDAESSVEAAIVYSDIWRRIHEKSESINAGGLSDVTEFICFNTQRIIEACRESRCKPENLRILKDAGRVLQEFAREPFDADTLGNLIYYLQHSDWPVSMSESQAYEVMARILEQLQSDGSEEPAESAAAGISATDEVPQDQFRLTLPDDVHPQLVEAFFNEVPHLAEEFTTHVQNLLRGGDRDDLLRAQRLSHTIKGSSNVTGVPGVAILMHSCEDLLEDLYGKQKLPDAELAQLLMDAADCLASQLEYLRGEGPEPTQTAELVTTLKACHAGIEGGSQAQASSSTGVAGADEPARTDGPKGLPESMRVPSVLIENLLRQAGEISISTVQLQGLSESLGRRMETLVKQQTLLWERLGAVQELVELRGVSAPKNVAVGQTHGAAETVFDSLEMDEYNELHSAASFLAESVTDSREYTSQMRDELNKLGATLKQQDILSRELNESVMSTRMVPFGSIASRLSRVVRQTAKSTGKSVDLSIVGEDVLVDSAVLSGLTDSLMHLLRNAVDHGIEEPDARIQAGKPETGRVSIHVERYGDNVSLVIQDDGSGLDYDRIRQIGVDRGLIHKDPTELSDQDLARLILLPGFTTRDETTQISGRGIGMDVVNTAVIEQRGTLDIQSEPGEGIKVSIRVPMTLISVHTLLVRNSGVVLGIPSSSVQQLIFSDLGVWNNETGEPVFRFEECDYRVVSLSNLVGIDMSAPELEEGKPIPLVLVQGEPEPYAVILDEVLDNRYLVVKRLGKYVPRLPGVIGGSILADGSVAGVVDVRELLRLRAEGAQNALQNIAKATGVDARQNLPAVLVVDDSVSARRLLSELVSDAGYRSMTAVDGLAALEVIEQQKPAAILLDMEMPRMNGLELAKHLRTKSETSDIPLIMVTSRSTEKHRRQADTAGVDRYFTKPYQEDVLIQELNGLIQ